MSGPHEAWADGRAKPVLTASAKLVPSSMPDTGEFTYAVLPMASTPSNGSERRRGPRHRTRLRSGKLIRRDGQFLCECLINNRSPSGCRVKLPLGIPDLQSTLFFYDDQSELLFQARLIWRKDRDIGLRLAPCVSNRLNISIVGAMRRKF